VDHIKKEIYQNGRQTNNKYDLWEEENVTPGNVSTSTIGNLTADVDNRPVRVLKKKEKSML